MKKLTLILAFVGMITLGSCSDDTDNDTIAETFEYTNVDFLPNDYSVVLEFPHSVFTSDMVLVYRLSGVFQGEDVWKLLPETYYFDDGTLDLRYDFDFTRFDAEVRLEGFDLANVSPAFTQDQILRVVVIPASFNKTSVDFKDYNAVAKAFNIKENKIVKMAK
ncbi:hypothetical protein [Flavobacterium sp.]